MYLSSANHHPLTPHTWPNHPDSTALLLVRESLNISAHVRTWLLYLSSEIHRRAGTRWNEMCDRQV